MYIDQPILQEDILQLTLKFVVEMKAKKIPVTKMDLISILMQLLGEVTIDQSNQAEAYLTANNVELDEEPPADDDLPTDNEL